MTVFVPAQTMDVKFDTTPNKLNVSCEATGLFPRPKLKLYRLLLKERTPAIVKDASIAISNSRDTYNTSLYKTFEHDELSIPGTTGFECVVEIPGTNYQRRKRVAYYADVTNSEDHQASRNLNFILFVSTALCILHRNI
ncbi:unnamed protein product [Larinioides sclopetarius]|uniref:CD80-like immunoglobulin C2-set domain-containing protein n=1 Tax=Larinioides sclopetarius TaxID=280406 RepID=A0AAV1YUH6_9ARAC